MRTKFQVSMPDIREVIASQRLGSKDVVKKWGHLGPLGVKSLFPIVVIFFGFLAIKRMGN